MKICLVTSKLIPCAKLVTSKKNHTKMLRSHFMHAYLCKGVSIAKYGTEGS